MKLTKIGKVFIILIPVIIILIFSLNILLKKDEKEKTILIPKFNDLNDVILFETDNNLSITKEYINDFDVEKDKIISQNINEGSVLDSKKEIKVIISKGPINPEIYIENNVNELGNVPIMMYHGIVNQTDSQTSYTGGNVDKDGYNRTTESFREDLEFYYKNNYRMIRLIDYINGDIDVEIGKSPIVLTFDDGRSDNFHVLGKNEDGSLIIDPNCAIGIFEEFKKKYNVKATATFFLNSHLFGQPTYNEEMLKWLVDNGYDIGNHTTNHANLRNISYDTTVNVVGNMYKILEDIIGDKYVKIVALPYGSPGNRNHANFNAVLSGNVGEYKYTTVGALQVGWDSNHSPFSTSFDPTYMKRCRAYDNNGSSFDIAMVFKLLEKTRYISDGDKNTIVIKEKDKNNIREIDKRIVTY